MKNINYKQIKTISNLPKYEFGKDAEYGYQTGISIPSYGHVDNQGADLKSMAKGQGQQNIAQGISDLGSTITDTISNYKSGDTMSAIGSGIQGIMDAGQGVYNTAHVANNADLQSWTGSQYNTGIGNRSYNTITMDQDAARKYLNKEIAGGQLKTTVGGLKAGLNVGTAINPGLGTLIGGAAGLLGGGLTALFTGNNEKDQVATRLSNQANVIGNYNRQSESDANTLGMRDEYALRQQRRAAKNGPNAANGKQPFDPKWNGQNGWAHNGEYQYRPSIGQGQRITSGTGKKENAPVYTEDEDIIYTDKFISPTTGKNAAESAEAAANNIQNGFMPQYNEQLLSTLLDEQKDYQNMTVDQKKKLKYYKQGKLPEYKWGKVKLNVDPTTIKQRGIEKPFGDMPEFGNITKQDDKIELLPIYNRRNYDVSNHSESKQDWMPFSSVIGSYLANNGLAMQQYFRDKNMKPMARRSYVPDNSMDIIRNTMRPYKDYTAYNELKNQALQSRYNIAKTARTTGDRLIAFSNLNDMYSRNAANVLSQINQMYNKDMSTYGQALASADANVANRMTRDNELYNDALYKSYGSKYTNMKSDIASIMQNKSNLAQNLLNLHFGNRAYSKYDDNNWRA